MWYGELPEMAQLEVDGNRIGKPMPLGDVMYWVYRLTRRYPACVIGWVLPRKEPQQ